MKRPPGLWLLLSAGVLWLSLQNVHARKATELIFGKTSTTSTTEIAPEGEQKDGASTENPEESENSIKNSNLTGNPQVDYLFDPNLPRELNGYNLSSYPFYNSMPEDIDFKCDGLHDGFYASVPHKCQVYHHCLFGTRFDFLCANYTAFDQKTFICHFVSEVDCNNSRKYWHRNDALYEAASTTTTPKPPPVVISPALDPANRRPSPAVRRPRPSRRRPQYDYYDEEYDEDGREDYYEEPPPRRRRKRPRPYRRRPIYDDDYEDYEDERYERRGSGRRNGDDNRKPPYDRRDSDDRRGGETDKQEYDSRREPGNRHNLEVDNRSSDRKQPDDRPARDNDKDIRDRDYDRREVEDRRMRDDDKPYDRKGSDDRRNREGDRKPPDRKESDDRRNKEDERKPYDRRESDDTRVDGGDRKQYDRRDYDDRRYTDRPNEGKQYKDDRRRNYDDDQSYRYDRDRRKNTDRKRRPDDDYNDRDDRRSTQDKSSGNDRRSEKRRPNVDQSSSDRPRKSQRRPYDDELYEDRDDDRRNYNRPRKNENKDDVQPQSDKRSPESDGTPLIKPNSNSGSSSSSSVFNQPRMPPRIRLPVPKNEQSKFSHKTVTEKPAPKKPEDEDEEYYDYEDEPQPPKPTTSRPTKKPQPEPNETRRSNKHANSERDEKRETRRPLGSASRPRVQMSRKPAPEAEDEYAEDKPRSGGHSRPRYDLDNRDSKTGSNSRNRAPAKDDFEVPEKDDEDGKSVASRHMPANKERNTSQHIPKFIAKERSRIDSRDKPKSEPISSTTTTTTTTTKEPPRERHEPVVKVVKRPFLPSRGGNPYSARGLQPVGAKALDSSNNSPSVQQDSNTSNKPLDYNDNIESDPQPINRYNAESSRSSNYNEPRQNYKLVSASISNTDDTIDKYNNPVTDDSTVIKNGRQFPTSTEPKTNPFVINEQPVENYKRRPSEPEVSSRGSYETPYRVTEAKEPPPPPEEKPFKPSPILIKVPVRVKYTNPISSTDDEEFRPVSNRPQSALRQKPKNYENLRTTEKAVVPERNPLDINENEYDVTLNDALNPTIPNLPIRNFPASFSADSDYTYSSFQRPRYDVALNQASENRYQVRAPSQRIETVQPYIDGDGKKYTIAPNAQYSLASDQIYQTQNFRSSPQITQAQTHAYYTPY